MLKPWILELGDAHTPQSLSDDLSAMLSKLDAVHESLGSTMPGTAHGVISHLIYRLREAEAYVEPTAPEPAIKVGDFVRRKPGRTTLAKPMRVTGEDIYRADGQEFGRWLILTEAGSKGHIAKSLVERVEVIITPAHPEVWTVKH
jgi:hypothetical protein